jgi:hypothetical protein
MSLEQKRQHWFDADDNEYYVSELRTAAAVYIAALEAELAALKGRRCDECDSREGQSHYCLLLSINTGDAFYCDFWTARAEEGGE